MNTPKLKTAILLAYGLALAAMPSAFAEHPGTPDAMFKKMDANNDSKVSRAEHAASSQKMFTDADANHDGSVTLAEMEAAHVKMKADHAKSGMSAKNDMPAKPDHAMKEEMSAADMVKMCDQNTDGKISQAEHTKHADAMFTKMDTDGDGSLTASECSAGHEKMMKDKKTG